MANKIIPLGKHKQNKYPVPAFGNKDTTCFVPRCVRNFWHGEIFVCCRVGAKCCLIDSVNRLSLSILRCLSSACVLARVHLLWILLRSLLEVTRFLCAPLAELLICPVAPMDEDHWQVGCGYSCGCILC